MDERKLLLEGVEGGGAVLCSGAFMHIFVSEAELFSLRL